MNDAMGAADADGPTADPESSVTEVARRIFGWEGLRPGQVEAVEAVLGGADVLAVMPTGYGKSAVYQLAGHLLDGPTVVVSPLISLQVDQIKHIAEQRMSDGAVAVNSSQSAGANREAWRAIRSHEAEFLFLAPEQLARDEVVDQLATLDVSLLVIDEAHCVSSWGHDFRPDYLRLGRVAERIGSPRVLALTATASKPVRDEIVQRLAMRDPRILVHGFDRPNLTLRVMRRESRVEKAAAIERQLADLPAPGLVYVSTHAEAESLSTRLGNLGYRAAAYHAGQSAAERDRTHRAFHAGEKDVVVATSAFGMGIDKPDIRFVVHADIPDSLDDYYQQIGRAGRDGAPATAVLDYRPEDLGLQNYFGSRMPSGATVARITSALAARPNPLTVHDLAEATGLSARSITSIVETLTEAGAAIETASGIALAEGVSAEQAADSVRRSADHHRLVAQSRIALMRAYAETLHCRRQFLLGYFGEDLPHPCGNCDTCASGSAARHPYADASGATGEAGAAYASGTVVEHAEWGPGTVLSVESDRILAFFPAAGYKTLSRAVVAEGGILTVRPDPGMPSTGTGLRQE